MKHSTKAFYGLSALAGAALVVAMSSTAPVQAQAQTQAQGNVCLNVVDVRYTKPTDRRTIIYTMWNGDVWRNDLATPCPDLINSARGYAQVLPTGKWICANTQHITTQNGSVCRLGLFTRLN